MTTGAAATGAAATGTAAIGASVTGAKGAVEATYDTTGAETIADV
jgi:hypothetical protein